MSVVDIFYLSSDVLILYSLFTDPSVIGSKVINQVIVEGDNVILHCNATGNPAPNISWTKDGSPTILYQGETNDIVNVTRQTAGNYTCTAWNGVGVKANATATVIVHYNSVISQKPSSKVVVEGENVTLRCNATGNPAPNITWTKDGSPTVLYQGETYSIVNIQRQAAGDYTCTAWNGVGEKTNATAKVIVHCKFICFLFILGTSGFLAEHRRDLWKDVFRCL